MPRGGVVRILAIRGCNLASLAGEFEIDLARGALGARGRVRDRRARPARARARCSMRCASRCSIARRG